MKIKNLKIDGYENFDFPLDKKDICHILDKLPSEDFDGLKDIIITNAKTKIPSVDNVFIFNGFL